MSTLDDYQWPTCTACTRQLREDEIGRVGCRICQQRADTNLADLAGASGLYAQLGAALIPGASPHDNARITNGGRTAPLPLRLEPLSLSARGGIVTILQTWLVDWHDTLGWHHPRWEGDLQQQLDNTAQALRRNLPWAASSHPAFPDFATELADLTRSCRLQTTGERPERRIALNCPCGHTIRVTLSTPGARCNGCGTQYGRAEAFRLPIATRAAA